MRPDQLPSGLRDVLSAVHCYKNIEFAKSSGANDIREHKERVEVDYKEAQVASSALKHPYPGRQHVVALDIDHQAWLVPSSNPGHNHLYVALMCEWNLYVEFLEAAAKIGLVESGYVAASKKRGATYLRLPWVKKGAEEFASITDVESFLNEQETEAEPELLEVELLSDERLRLRLLNGRRRSFIRRVLGR